MDTIKFKMALEEYRQAGAIFRTGFQLIFNITRGFLLFNSILLGILILLGKAHEESSQFITNLTLFIAAVGAAGGPCAFLVHMRMTKYIRSWLARAKDIEHELSMKLLTQTYDIEVNGRSNLFQSYTVAAVLYFSFSLAWGIIFIALLLD